MLPRRVAESRADLVALRLRTARRALGGPLPHFEEQDPAPDSVPGLGFVVERGTRIELALVSLGICAIRAFYMA
jgi:hypothetical protein